MARTLSRTALLGRLPGPLKEVITDADADADLRMYGDICRTDARTDRAKRFVTYAGAALPEALQPLGRLPHRLTPAIWHFLSKDPKLAAPGRYLLPMRHVTNQDTAASLLEILHKHPGTIIRLLPEDAVNPLLWPQDRDLLSRNVTLVQRPNDSLGIHVAALAGDGQAESNVRYLDSENPEERDEVARAAAFMQALGSKALAADLSRVLIAGFAHGETLARNAQ